MALEVKLASVVDDHDVRHLRWLQEEMGDDLLDAVVITTGEYAYRRPDDAIAVIPAALLGPRQRADRQSPDVEERTRARGPEI